MNKEQLLAKADKLITQADELISKANELKELANKEETIIYVPDNIKLSKIGDVIAIHNGRHKLLYANGFFDYVIYNGEGSSHIKCKLTPCKYEDLKPGDVFYMDGSNYPDFDDLNGYAVKLEEGYQLWWGKNCNYGDTVFKYNWKVEPV